MVSIVESIAKLIVSAALILAAVWAFNRITGYGEYYDQMLHSDENNDNTITNERKNKNGNINNDELNHQK